MMTPRLVRTLLIICSLSMVVILVLSYKRGQDVDAYKEKAKKYDEYCQALRLTLRTAAPDLRNLDQRANSGKWLADRLEARRSSDDIMNCVDFDLLKFETCLARSDYDCAAEIVSKAEQEIQSP